VHSRDPDFVEVAQDTEVSEGAGRSIGIGLKDTIKTKLNNFKGIQKEETNVINQIYPVRCVSMIQQKFYQSNLAIAISLRCHWLRLWQRVRVELLNIGLNNTVKTKLNDLKRIQNETTNIANQIYPVDVSADTAKVLPIKSSDSNFVEVSLAPPVATGAGRNAVHWLE
jgi:copper chaperone CopZ